VVAQDVESHHTDKPYDPQRHNFNEATINNYLYPTNHPKRDYQYEIIRACFTDNCLVALPTGLGKTFVAGVVMLNCASADSFGAIELTLSLPLVPYWQDRLPRADQTARQPANRGVSNDLWHPLCRRGRHDWHERQRQGARTIGE
jgi:hypothetical protein